MQGANAADGSDVRWSEFARWYLVDEPDPTISPYSPLRLSQVKDDADPVRKLDKSNEKRVDAIPVTEDQNSTSERNVNRNDQRPALVHLERPAFADPPEAPGFVAVVSSEKAPDIAEQIAVNVRSKAGEYLQGRRINVRQVDIPGKGIFYRVVIEPSDSRSEAMKTCNKLRALGFKDCFLVAHP